MDFYDSVNPLRHRYRVRDGGVCWYCGAISQSEDHVIPRSIVGNTGTIRVPACKECNSLARDLLFETIKQKRAYIKARLRQRYRRILALPDWEPEELAGLKPELRKKVERGLRQKAETRERLRFKAEEDGNAIGETGVCCMCNASFIKEVPWQVVCSYPCRKERNRRKASEAARKKKASCKQSLDLRRLLD